MPNPKHYRSWAAYSRAMAYIHIRGLDKHHKGDVYVAGKRHHPHHSTAIELEHAKKMAMMEPGRRKRNDGIPVTRRK